MNAHIRKSVQALDAYVPGEQPREPGIVKLNTNENPYPPSPRVLEALRAFDGADLRRYPDPVSSGLRRAIATLHGVDETQVFAGNGSDEVLALCTRAFVEHGGTVGYFDTTYSLYPVLTEMAEEQRRPVELGPDFTWAMPPDYRASLFFLANPNAPTGMRFPAAEVDAFCARFPGVVLIDEAYVDFAEADCMHLARTRDNVLVSRTLSKSFALAGLRVGYAVGARALIEALFKIKDSYNMDALSQRLALAAIEDVAYMRARAGQIKATRERVRAALESGGHRVTPSETNFLWMQPAAGSASEVFQELRRLGIVVRHFPGPKTGTFLRVTIATDADMDRFLGALEQITDGKRTR